jgi:hypothetical protein
MSAALHFPDVGITLENFTVSIIVIFNTHDAFQKLQGMFMSTFIQNITCLAAVAQQMSL